MKVYGQLEKAQAENVTSDTASEPKGMFKYRTDQDRLKVSNGTTYKELVETDTAQTLSNKTLVTPLIDDASDFEQVPTPAVPAAGRNKLYFKNDDKLYALDSAGNETQVGTGQSASSLEWYLPDSNAPTEAVLSNGLRVLKFAGSPDAQEVFVQIAVPASYLPGVQISLTEGKIFASQTTGNVLMRCTTHIMKAGVDGTSVPASHASTNTQVAVSGTSNNIVALGAIDLTDVSGEISGVPVAAGDVLLVKLVRATASETSGLAGDANLLRSSFQPKFTA